MSSLRDLFDRIEDVAPAERDAWITAHCPDPLLRAQLQAILQEQSTGTDPLQRPLGDRLAALDGVAPSDALAERWLGRAIGSFRLIRLIGQGGMAVVFEAERIGADFEQRVAIKVLKRLLFSTMEERQFRRERQALAALAHPNIARLIDGGIAADGTPFLAVELIDGLPITRYCELARLDLRQRLLLFATVCRAVEAAHRALIVHRDIKPSNILVTPQGQPKLLDFGIAKLLDEDADPTRTGMSALTPGYAAPEQFIGGAITTATDVYALGVLLHELLLGVRPVSDTRRPSAHGPVLVAVDGSQALPVTVRSRLKGDLDNIMLKALEPEAERRYSAAGTLADDIDRHLAGMPVLAHPPSPWYRTRKFVQRHRTTVGVSLLLVVALLVSLGVSVWQAQVARRNALVAVQQSQRAEIVRDFVVELMRDLRPGVTNNSPQSLLERAEQRARERFAADPQTRAALLLVMGDIELGYGRLDRSRALLEEAASIARAAEGPASRIWLEAEAYLAHTAYRQGRYVEGNARLLQALHDYDAARGPASAARVRALTHLGMLRAQVGNMQRALQLQDEAVQLASRVLPATDPLQQIVLENYGDALANDGQLELARPVLIRSLARARQLYGNRDMAVISALEALAVCETARGAPDAALPLLAEAQDLLQQILSEPHVMAAYVANTLGTAELRLGRPLRAAAAFQQAMQVYRKLLQAPHPMLAATYDNLGEAAYEQGRYQQAALAFDEAATQREALAGSTVYVSRSLRCLSAEARAAGADPAAGLVQLQRCIDTQTSTDASLDLPLTGALGALAYAQWRNGDHALAEQNARAALHRDDATEVHERLRPLAVTMRADAKAGRANAVHAAAKKALSIVASAPWARPCQTIQLLRELADIDALAAGPGWASALRLRADSGRCELPP